MNLNRVEVTKTDISVHMTRTFLLLLILSACSHELRIYTDFDRDIEIHRLPNYQWLDAKSIESRNDPIHVNELTGKRIKAAVDKQMYQKGYTRSDSGAQIVVHYHITVENRVAFRPEPLGYNYSRYWVENRSDAYRYREGTLILDFMDSRNCDLIWRGWAVSILDDNKPVDEELINQAVEEIFMAFPTCYVKEMKEP